MSAPEMGWGMEQGDLMYFGKTGKCFFALQRHLICFVLQRTAFERPLQRSAFLLILFLIIFIVL